MDVARIQHIISSLEHIAQYTPMYIGDVDPEKLRHFINGFNIACRVLGEPGGYDSDYDRAVLDRGWGSTNARLLYEEMISKGFDAASITRELIMIELEAWKRRLTSASLTPS